MESIVESAAEGVDALGHELGPDIVAKIAVERGEHLGRVLERERQSRHLGHRHERPQNVAGHVHLKLVLLQHREHDIVGAELAFGVKVDLHPPAGFGADVVGHFLQPNVIRAVERLAHTEPVANVGRSGARAGAGNNRGGDRAGQEAPTGKSFRDNRQIAHGVSPIQAWMAIPLPELIIASIAMRVV
jgi:hypothetical protein